MTASNPVRYPDTRSPRLMTRRAWWLVALNLLIPGSAQVLAGNRRVGRFALGATIVWWIAVVLALVLWFAARTALLTVVASTGGLVVIAIALVFYAVLWTALTLDTLRLVRFVSVTPSARGVVAALAALALAVTAGGAGLAAINTFSAIKILGIFGGGEVAAPIDGRYNILLMGGDAGADRLGLRPDSISVVSIDAETGSTTIFGIPRNLEYVPFAEGSPLWDEFPNGYDCGVDCLIYYLYGYGEEHPELYPGAEKKGSTPGVEAMRDAVEGVLGLEMQYYVLIDMQGFAGLIDALGGIDIEVAERLPLGANTYDDGTPAEPIGYIEAGQQHLDGQTALWYARSRYGSSDYERMARQRQVQEAILAQFEPANVLLKFQGIAEAGTQVVSTDIPQGMLPHLVDLATKAQHLPLETIDFVPPEYHPDAPDFALIHARVDEELAPADSDAR